jgi:hypothetical protein
MAGKNKIMQAVVSFAGTIDPSLGKAMDNVAGHLDKVNWKAVAVGAAVGGIAVATGKAVVEAGKYLAELGDDYNKAMNQLSASTGATGDALAGKAAASHTHNYAGSSSAGGAANSANKLNKNAGSATQGVYFKDGVPVAMPHTLGKSVPADAKFTDTNTWRGVQDNLTSTATDQSLSANQGKVLKGLVDGKAASSHTHDDRYYTESEMNTKLNGKANSSHTHNYAGSSSAGGTANSVNGLTFAAQTTDPGAGSSLATNKVLIVYQ